MGYFVPGHGALDIGAWLAVAVFGRVLIPLRRRAVVISTKGLRAAWSSLAVNAQEGMRQCFASFALVHAVPLNRMVAAIRAQSPGRKTFECPYGPGRRGLEGIMVVTY